MDFLKTIEGATPIEDPSDLIPTHIMTREELNEWEAVNIMKATRKYLTKRKHKKVSIDFLKTVHKDMFSETWKWAGRFRRKNYNLGVDWSCIYEELQKLIDDLSFWQRDSKGFSLLSQSVRLHHRLVMIHPFDNGNGRHTRLVSDIFLFSHNHNLPLWPHKELILETDIRRKYIAALKAADKGNYLPLEDFIKRLF